MPTTSKVSRTRDTARRPLPHDEAAKRARQYATRAMRDATRLDDYYTPTPWIEFYMPRYRYLTGRPRYAGPKPVWDGRMPS